MKKFFSYQTWILFSLLFLTVLAIVSLNNSYHGDEKHIIETIRLFANNLSFETIKEYPEVTPPFFFIFYAIWAKLFGQSLESLRILTLLISFAAWQLLYLLNLSTTKNEKHSFLLSLLIIANPYFFGTSVYVFTDMLTILFVLSSVLSFLKSNHILFFLFSTFAILCRQYAIIIPFAIIIYSILIYKSNKSENTKFIIASTLSFLPLVILYLIWNGIAPKSGIEKWIIRNSSSYNLDYINTYLTFSVVYTLPLQFFFIKKIKVDLITVLISLGLTLILSFFPIKPSAVTLIQTTQTTVGYAHKFLYLILGSNSVLVILVLGILLFVGSYMGIELIRVLLRNYKESVKDYKIIFTFLWILFLLIMPFSYQVWEKYLTMVLPFYSLSLYLLLNHNKNI